MGFYKALQVQYFVQIKNCPNFTEQQLPHGNSIIQ